MRIQIRATEGDFVEDDFSLVCGLCAIDAEGNQHGLYFERLTEVAAVETPDEDWGIYVEFDEQINGAYNRVANCRICRTRLQVDLNGQLGHLAGVDGFDVELPIDDSTYEQLTSLLKRVFRGTSELVMMS